MKKRGQSIIEFCLIAVLVIIGIVYMGPYVLRSIDAHYKLWDDGVQDSFTEDIKQAPVNDVPFINQTCSCYSTNSTCGSYGGQCGADQRIVDHYCTPQLCDSAPASSCLDDPSCCKSYWKQGCGTIPLVAVTPATNPPTYKIPPGTAITSDGTNLLPGTGGCQLYSSSNNNCYYGQIMYATECSDVSIACCPDTTECNPVCIGVDSPGATICSNNPHAPPELNQSYNISYVGSSGACDGHTPCQVYCANGYMLNASGTSCLNQFQVAPALFNCNTVSTGCTHAGHVTVDDQSFNFCPNTPGTTMTAVKVTDISSPETYPYCDQPSGNPGEECQMSFTYH